MAATLAGAILAFTSLLLLVFGLNLLYLSYRALRLPPASPPPPLEGPEPLVCVQLPIYDERHVAERVIAAAGALDWPRDRLEIQVLDDSDDETVEVVERAVSRLRRRGILASHVRRGSREGFKAGALAHGLGLTEADLLCIFDADFKPPPGFLRATIGAFKDGRVGFAQARWGHLNEGYSWLTRLQALAVDYHFLVEQPVRSGSWFTNFTGTAGIWRREAIVAAGGWSDATLTEDLDLSYRAQLAGWKPAYLESVVVPEELPVEIDGYRRQQSRWATGSFQTAYRMLPRLLRAKLSAGARWQAGVHLLSYAVGPLMLVQLACYPFLLRARIQHHELPSLGSLGLVINAVTVAPWAGFMVAQARAGRRWWRGVPAILCQVLGAGLSVTVLVALMRSVRSGGRFERTPKYRIERAGEEWRDSVYARAWSPTALLELAVGLASLATAVEGVRVGLWLVALYSAVFATGLLGLAGLSAAEAVRVLTLRRLGLRLGPGLIRLLGGAGLLVLPALLLVGVAMAGQPFEDSYQHWLVAANLALGGRLEDSLFAMQDTWLPGYHLLAGAVLKVFGWHRLDALVGLAIASSLVSVALVARLAGSGLRALIATTLLALNPAFLLTSVSVVAEPVTLALLLGATASAQARRWPLAALLAAAAALTATKAWLWLVALAAVLLLGHLAGRRAPRPRLVWLAPALAVLVLLQLGFAPASHSVARAAVEVSSAGRRGSLPPGSLQRLAEFAGWFLLASAPLAVLLPLGLLAEGRSAQGWARIRLLHAPALAYLAVVAALVAAGAYSGSHRYYYLALPALALLAAAALDGHRLAGVPAVAAAGLIAVAYLPVFASFAGANAGLAAAGRASARVEGRLLTDSPVAAFYSGKQPSQINGSMALPADPAAAVAWLRQGDYTSLVLEDIDYYRASELFPALAAGTAAPPFQPLGSEAAYSVPGGKPAFAYSLAPATFDAAVADGVVLCLNSDLQPRAGKTAELAKGAVLEVAGAQLAGEGVGFGVPAARFADGWYFPGSSTVEDLSDGTVVSWRKTFELDLREADRPDGSFLAFQKVASAGFVQVTYRVRAGKLDVALRPQGLRPGLEQFVVLNEESAGFDDFADSNGTSIGSAFGSWQPAAGDWARLRSAHAGVEWSQPALPGAALMAARELRPPYLDFAGLEYVFGPDFGGAAYTVTIGRAR